MTKINLPTINSGYASTEALNQAMADIAEAFDNTLSRDGSAPNEMSADINMENHRIINLPFGVSDGEPITVAQIATISTGYVVQRQETYDASGAETLVNFNTLTYVPGSNNLGVYKNGVRLFTPADYAETSSTSITLLTPLLGTDTIVAVSNEFFGSLEPPVVSFVPWGSIVGAPSYATRDPDWTEVTGKPTEFTPASHQHSAGEITSGRLADARRGVFVQSSTPTATAVGDLWFW